MPVKIADVRDEPACVCFMHWQQDQSLSSERRRTGKHAEGSCQIACPWGSSTDCKLLV